MENAVVHSAHCPGERTAPALESRSRGAERSVSLLLFPPCRISPGWPTPNLVQVHRQYQDEGHSQESTMPSPSPAVLLPCTSSCSASNLLLLHACSGQWCYWQIPPIRSNAESTLLHLNARFFYFFSFRQLPRVAQYLCTTRVDCMYEYTRSCFTSYKTILSAIHKTFDFQTGENGKGMIVL